MRFLTHVVFDTLLKRMQKSIKEAPDSQTREALAHELAILLKAGEAFGEQYLRDGEAYIERIPRTRWKEESSRYIEEPSRDSEQPRLVRLIDYVEYYVRGGSHALLPPGSVLVDLPGGSAGQLHHDTILREELNTVDAVVICERLAQSTEQRIARLFRYELDGLEKRLVLTSNALREQLDSLQAQHEVNVDRWVELILEVEALKTMHRQA